MTAHVPMEQAQAALALAAACRTAEELGLVERLAAGGTTAEVAGGLEARAVEELLRVLQAGGLVHREEAGWRLVLSPDEWALTRLWDGLTRRIRDGVPAVGFETPAAAELYASFTPRLARWVEPLTDEVVDWVTPRLPPGPLDVLDLGVGGAPWSLALARRRPCRVVGVDRPAVLASTRRCVDEAGLGQHFDLKAADFLTDPLGESEFDLAILGSVLHLLGEADGQTLLRSVARALRPGGVVWILEGRREDPPGLPGAAYALGLVLRTSAGGLHPLSAYLGWLRGTGFSGLEHVAGSHRGQLIIGRKA